ncbi:MAG: TolC family protein [Cyanobacteria bacterium P01_D01_bin.73]
MGVWYRTVATSASAALTLCLLTLGQGSSAAAVTAVSESSEAEVEVSISTADESSEENSVATSFSPVAEEAVAVQPPELQPEAYQHEDLTLDDGVENGTGFEEGEIAAITPEIEAPQPEATQPLEGSALQTENSESATTERIIAGASAGLGSVELGNTEVIRAPGTEIAQANGRSNGQDRALIAQRGGSQLDESVRQQNEAAAESLGDATVTNPPTANVLEGGDLTPLESNPNPLQYPTLPEEVQLLLRQPITLEQALELARRNSRQLVQARLNLEQAQQGLKVAIASRYPQLNLTANLINSLASGTRLNLLQANQTTRRAGGNDVVDDPADRNADTTSYTVNLQLSYNIYSSGQRLNQVRAARAQVEDAELAVEAAFEELRFSVTNAYYVLQQETEQLLIDEKSVEFRLQNVKDAEALEKAGLGTRFEVLQAEVELANDRQRVEQTQSRLTQARRDLARQLSLPQVIDIDAADPVQTVGTWTLNLEDSILTAYRNRAELAQRLARREEADAQRRVQLAQNGPQINAVAEYELFDQLEFEDNFGPVYGYSASLQLSWNLFDGGANRAQAAQQDSLRRQAENEFAIQRDSVRFDVEQSYADLIANISSIRTSLQAIEAADEEVRLARLRFQAGVGTQTDRLNAETRFIRARGNVLQAIIGYNQAVSALRRAVSNISPGTVNFDAAPVRIPELKPEEGSTSSPPPAPSSSPGVDSSDIFGQPAR